MSMLFTAIVSGNASWISGARAESFDKPLRKEVVDLGLSPDFSPSDNVHIKLTCTYYPTFMVKQLEDTSSEGALGFAIVKVRPGHVSACVKAQGLDEKTFAKKWCGYFSGVKRGLVFLDGCDGFSGGISFAAFDSKSGTEVFEDLISTKDGDIDFVRISQTQLALRYTRVFIGDCSVPKQGQACWSRFRKQSGLETAPMPKCSDYEGPEVGIANSVIAYPVEASLFPKPSVKALSNPTQCWPSD